MASLISAMGSSYLKIEILAHNPRMVTVILIKTETVNMVITIILAVTLNVTEKHDQMMLKSMTTAMIRGTIKLACRLWVHNDEPSEKSFTAKVLRLASLAPAQYVRLMNQSGMHIEKPPALDLPCVKSPVLHGKNLLEAELQPEPWAVHCLPSQTYGHMGVCMCLKKIKRKDYAVKRGLREAHG